MSVMTMKDEWESVRGERRDFGELVMCAWSLLIPASGLLLWVRWVAVGCCVCCVAGVFSP